MRNVKFILSAIAILLAGAIAAGLAARAVTAPDASEVRSAGTVSIPTVLGQTAEEVLFYPWSMYDTDRLYPLSERDAVDVFDLTYFNASTIKEAAKAMEEFGGLAYTTPLLAMLTAFSSFEGLDLSWEKLLSSLEWNVPPQGDVPGATHLFLRELPASLKEKGAPVTFSFALGVGGSTNAVSCLIRPEQAEPVTQEQQEAALRQVDSDLRLLFQYGHDPQSSEMSLLLLDFFGALRDYYDYCLEQWFPWWDLNIDYNRYSWGGYDPALLEHWTFLHTEWDPEINSFAMDPDLPLEEFLSVAENLYNFTGIQIIDTQQQILVLFTTNNGLVFGVYYDIQLGCWSGVGAMS